MLKQKMKDLVKYVVGIFGYIWYCNKPGNYVFMNRDIGSLVYPLAYLEAAKENFYDTPIFLMTVKKYRGVCKLFYDDLQVVAMNKLVLNSIVAYLRKTGKTVTRSKKIYHFYNNTDSDKIMDWGNKIKDVSWTSYALRFSYIFSIDPASKIRYGNASNVDPKQLKHYIDYYGIVKNKSVILIPYTVSGVLFPDSFWEDLSKRLQQLNYEVFSNAPDERLMVKGTKRVNVPLEYVPALVECAGYAITIQTGLGDLLHLCNSPCSMIQNDAIYYMGRNSELSACSMMQPDYYKYKNSELSDYDRLAAMPKIEKNRYDLTLVGHDPFVFDKSYTDIYDSDEKLQGLIDQLVRDVQEKTERGHL